MTHDKFVKDNLGRYMGNFPGTTDPNQCMDLMRFYIRDVWGTDPYVLPRGFSAKDVWNKSKTTNLVTKIPNTPNGIPRQGDLIFFGTVPFYTGLAGHVAVVDSATLYDVTVFHINYPTGSPCNFRKFKYRYYGLPFVLGWIHKK